MLLFRPIVPESSSMFVFARAGLSAASASWDTIDLQSEGAYEME